jgi:hypothetical protein
MWTPGLAVLATTTVGGYGSVSSIMITAHPLHVLRLLQHSGPPIHFSKLCYEMRPTLRLGQSAVQQLPCQCAPKRSVVHMQASADPGPPPHCRTKANTLQSEPFRTR